MFGDDQDVAGLWSAHVVAGNDAIIASAESAIVRRLISDIDVSPVAGFVPEIGRAHV